MATITIDTPDSRGIQRIVFVHQDDHVRGTLYVKFRTGGLYEYINVPKTIFDSISSAHLAGGGVDALIENGIKNIYNCKALG